MCELFVDCLLDVGKYLVWFWFYDIRLKIEKKKEIYNI